MLDDAMIGPVDPPELHVMTWNVRRRIPHLRSRHPDRWALRRPLVSALLRRERPTLLGTQEALPDQADAILQGLGTAYRTVGHGRGADGGDESNAVFWDDARLRLLDWNQRALSGAPDVPGSHDWGNPWPRILVSAAFEDRATGQALLFVNTHLDPVSRRSRIRSSKVLRDLAAGSARPVIVTGDFNTGRGSATHRALTRSALFDLWDTTPRSLSPEWGTFPNYRQPRPGRAQIDWILGTRGIEVSRAGINSAREGGWPSDHMPVQAVVRLRDDR